MHLINDFQQSVRKYVISTISKSVDSATFSMRRKLIWWGIALSHLFRVTASSRDITRNDNRSLNKTYRTVKKVTVVRCEENNTSADFDSSHQKLSPVKEQPPFNDEWEAISHTLDRNDPFAGSRKKECLGGFDSKVKKSKMSDDADKKRGLNNNSGPKTYAAAVESTEYGTFGSLEVKNKKGKTERSSPASHINEVKSSRDLSLAREASSFDVAPSSPIPRQSSAAQQSNCNIIQEPTWDLQPVFGRPFNSSRNTKYCLEWNKVG